jgi:hypothetical protein
VANRCVPSILLILGLSLGACHASIPPARYIVTAAPLQVLGAGHPGLCIAIDPADAEGIWWWEPGPSGCSRRTTGPTVFHADDGKVASRQGADIVDARFTLQLHNGSRGVRLVLQNHTMEVAGSDARVSTERRKDLDIPFAYGR